MHPNSMLNPLSIRLFWRSLNWLARLAIEVAAAIAILIAALIIILRYSFLPDVEQYHSKITDSLSSAIGHPVTIARIEADWRGIWPHLSLSDVRILNQEQKAVLALQSIDARVSWMSLLTADLRLANLELIKPELLLRRDAQGDWFLDDLKLGEQGSNDHLVEWLLNQPRMVVRDALIVWADEFRDAPPLVMQQVNLRIESMFDRHSFALRALPPAGLSTELDVRGEFFGSNVEVLEEWRGQIFTQLDYTDVTAWKPWLDLPAQLSSGRGALRGWLGVDDGRVSRFVADLDLRDVVARLTDDVPEMVISKLQGRAAWSVANGGFEFSTVKLAMQMRSGLNFQPTDFYFRTAEESGNQLAFSQVRVNFLQLNDAASLAKFLPLPGGLREQLDEYAPKGSLANLDASWEGAIENPSDFKIKGQFKDIALKQVGAIPGFSGFSADVDGGRARGNLNIDSQQLHVDAPQIMREPLFFKTLTGQVGWRSGRGGVLINVDNVSVANDDLAGNMYASYRTRPDTLGELDLTARLTRGDIRHAARYTPLIALGKDGGNWLRGALLGGHTEDLRIRIKGNLSDFPIKDETSNVLFKIGGHAQDAVLKFHDDWPQIENIAGEFLIRGNRMEVISPSAVMSGARLKNVVVTLPDMTSQNLALMINGEATADNDTFLSFIQKSPVRGYINGFTDGVRASGKGYLNLSLRIPLEHGRQIPEQTDKGQVATGQTEPGSNPLRVTGNFQVQGSDIDLGEGIPWLRNTSGVLTFTESGMQANGVSSRILGGPAKIDVQSVGGSTVHAVVKGRSDLDLLRKSNHQHPLLNYLSGGAAWDADISLINGNAQIIINSDLQGVGSMLPQPFTKRANRTMPLRLEKTSIAAGEDMVTFRLDDLLDVKLERRDAGGNMEIRGGTIHLGAKDGMPVKQVQMKKGVWLTGHIPVFSAQGWGGVFGSQQKPDSVMPIAGVKMSIDNLVGYGKTLGAVQIDSIRQANGVAVRLTGEAVNGTVSWLPVGYESNSKFTARLRNLHFAEDKQVQPSVAAAESTLPDKTGQAEMLRPSVIPALEIAVESLQIKDNPFGRFDLVGHPEGDDWRMRRLNITNRDGSLSGDGVWRAVPDGTQTEVNLQLAIADAGNTLARSGYPDTVKGGKGTLTATLRWDGSPDQFKYSTLNGSLKLDTGKGQFLKMDPGAGKLLSILSMQALPMHVTTLDFSDVFSKGFQFDNIIGEATITNGVMDTQEFHVYGSAAKVALKGRVDLNNETQNLNVKVFPAVGDSVALLTVFAINPAAGIAGLIADKLLGSPLDKLVSFEYNVDGTWSNPNVVKLNRPADKLPK